MNGTAPVFGLGKHLSHSLQHPQALVANDEFYAAQAAEPLEETDTAGPVLLHLPAAPRTLRYPPSLTACFIFRRNNCLFKQRPPSISGCVFKEGSKGPAAALFHRDLEHDLVIALGS